MCFFKSLLQLCPLLMISCCFGQNAAPSTELIGPEKEYAKIIAEAEGKSKVPLRNAVEFTPRGGLPNLFAKLESGQEVTIAYYGGSITASSGWRTQTFDWFQKQYPQGKVNMLSASVGGSGSLVGVFRADHDLVAHQPDLVFIEFSLNDSGDVAARSEEVAGALEGIIRKLWKSKPETDICFVFTQTSGGVDLLNAGKCTSSISIHDSVAEHYHLPSIIMGMEVAKLSAQHKLVFKGPKSPEDKLPDGTIVFTNDGTHPTEAGHTLYAQAVIRGLEQMRASHAPLAHTLPQPMIEVPWEKAKTLPVEGHAEFAGTWEQLTAQTGPACRRFGKEFYNWFPHLWRTSTPDSKLTVRFRGTHIGVKGMEGPDAGMVSIQVDQTPPFKQSIFTPYDTNWVYVGNPLPKVESGDHQVTWTFLAESPDKEKILSGKKSDQDFRDHPEKYKDNTFSVGQIIVLGDLINAKGEVIP